MGGGGDKTSYTVDDRIWEQRQGPWLPSQKILVDLLNKAGGLMGQTNVSQMERNALEGLRGNIKFTNEYLPQMRGLLGDLFAGGGMGEGAQGIRDSWSTANQALTPIARGDFVNPESNPYLQQIIAKTQGDIRNQIGAQFAGAGRSFSGAHMKALGSGIGDATNQLYYDAYSGERDRQANAIRDLLSGSVGAASGLDSTLGAQLAARQAGAQFAPTVTGMRDDPYLKRLELGQMRSGLPFQKLGMLRDFVLPIAGMGSEGAGSSHGWSTTTQHQDTNPFQQIMGGLMGGLSMLSGNPMGMFSGLGSLFGSAGALGGGGMFNPFSSYMFGPRLY